jgi:hypothetical protein
MQRRMLTRSSLAIVLVGSLAGTAAAQTEGLGDPVAPTVEQAPLPVPPPPPDVAAASGLTERAQRLGTWLEAGASQEEVLTYTISIPGIAVGAAGIGFGIWVWADGFSSSTSWDAVLGALSFGSGVLLAAVSVYALAETGQRARRLLRWRETAPSLETIARFEGELLADAELAAAGRRALMGIGIGLELAAIPILVVSGALSGLDEAARIGGYALGGAWAALGVVSFILSFVTTPEENAWAAYQRGESPQASLSVEPVIGLGALGLRGTF